MFKADGKRREFPLKPGTHVIGRQKTCKLRIPLPSVSRRHAELTVTPGGEVSVRDLGSSNGTFRNGSSVEESVLEAGDELRIGPLDLILADAEETDAVQPPAAGGGAAGAMTPAQEEEKEKDPEDSDAADAFLLDDDSVDLGPVDPAGESVSSPSPLDASGSAAAIELEGGDDEPPAPKAAPRPGKSAAPDDDDDDEADLDDLLAGFGRGDDGDGDDGDDSEFDFLADVEVIDDDDPKA